ncbi:DUF3857 domain-containing protein [Cryomorpha ignava]|uniref:DUF3857 domain-containing protein n=1 Tax=Cryomorpha ignava TaxID=101383 RepID=A0A7K3WKQ5_9FLAO|nr:DUF3857 domain-containing protein [Cryomorpha ignava]NEN22230.1 DUF3857 domain-containing protein [Cryomorpha ignava]
MPDALKNHHSLFRFGVYIALISYLGLLPVGLRAQEQTFVPYDVKKVEPEDFSIESDLIDNDTEAIYLFDLGDSNLDISTETVLEFKRLFRIKILSENGLDLANQIIQLYIGRKDEEKIGKVKGGVYNLVNGKVDFEKLKNSDWSLEPYDENHKVTRVAFRNVKVGSIIELEYSIFSPFIFNMPDWEFQYDDIPVLYSEYYIRHPENIGYKILKMGYHPLQSRLITTETRVNSPQGIITNSTVKKVYAYACENVPAMRDEPLMDSPENYRTKIITELHYIDYISETDYFYKDWEASITDFIEAGEHEMFMTPSDKDNYLSLDTINCTTLLDSINVIYTKILEGFSDSEEPNALIIRKKPQDIIDSKKATPNEMNMLLVSTLRANGIEAYPVLVTKRSQQRVLKEFPLISQFSLSITAVNTEDGYMLLDATLSNLAIGEISEKYYNGDGLVVNKEKVEWIPIVSNEPTSESCSIEFGSFEENKLKGVMRLKLSGIYRSRIKNVLRYSSSSELTKFLDINENATITFNEQESDLHSSPLDLRFNIMLKLEKFGSSYLLPSIIYKSMANNILKEKDRNYPVNFPDAWSETYTCLVHLDSEKYAVNIPENANFVLPDDGGNFSYLGSYNLGNLLIRNKVDLHKNTFLASEYPFLRQFYDLISTSHSSFIEITEK